MLCNFQLQDLSFNFWEREKSVYFVIVQTRSDFIVGCTKKKRVFLTQNWNRNLPF